MKKMQWYPLTLTAEIVFLVILLLGFIPFGNNEVISILLFSMAFLVIIAIGLTIAYADDKKTEEQRKSMISEFDLKKGEYVEVTATSLPNSIISSEIIKQVVKDIISSKSATIPDKYINVPYMLNDDTDILLTNFFIEVMKELGARFYLYLDYEENISLCIATTHAEKKVWFFSKKFTWHSNYHEFFKNFRKN